MPRPCKRRRVCAMPGCERFGPAGGGGGQPPVLMALDEFEAVRLIDLEGLSQEQCAARMDVSRTTAQAIYAGARVKLAQCLVNGRELLIQGGEYELCQGDKLNPGCRRCGGHCRWSGHSDKNDMEEHET